MNSGIHCEEAVESANLPTPVFCFVFFLCYPMPFTHLHSTPSSRRHKMLDQPWPQMKHSLCVDMVWRSSCVPGKGLRVVTALRIESHSLASLQIFFLHCFTETYAIEENRCYIVHIYKILLLEDTVHKSPSHGAIPYFSMHIKPGTEMG